LSNTKRISGTVVTAVAYEYFLRHGDSTQLWTEWIIARTGAIWKFNCETLRQNWRDGAATRPA
jgi:hypothetical protein